MLNAIKKGENSLYVDFSALSKYDIELSETLLNNFNEVISNAEEAIKDLDIPGAEYPITFRVLNLPKSAELPIRNIRSSNLNKLVSTYGVIRQASDVRPKVTLATFECPGCGAQILIEQKSSKFIEPMKCQCGRKGRFKLTDKRMVDVQRLVIEEVPESLEGGEQPKRINIFLESDLLNPKLEKKRYPGNKIKVVGVIKEIAMILRSGGQSTTYDLLIDANSIETLEEEFGDIILSKEDEKKIIALAKNENIYKMLTDSVAPSIYGYDSIKEAIALQLFGGVTKVRADGTRTRGDFHIFLIGDPGTAKSQLLRYIVTLAPKAKYMVGKGASAAGLTATVVRDEFMRGWALEAGALVLCNKGLAALDELDKMSAEDSSAMHEALEQQTITIAKANIHATLRAEVSVLAAANPKYGRFDPYAPIAKQIDLPPALINRFDLIFTIKDIPEPSRDAKIAQHILDISRNEPKKSEIDGKLLRKFIAYAKQNCFPKLTTDAMEEIKQFYIGLRTAAATDADEIKTIPISPRQLEALVRLSEASAKVRLSDRVTKADAQRAISLLRASMEEVALDIHTGKFDIDRITTGISATQRSQISIIRRLIDELIDKEGKTISTNTILNVAVDEGIERRKAEEVLETLKKKGDIFEPKHGMIQKIR